jgi:hypothetical protein
MSAVIKKQTAARNLPLLNVIIQTALLLIKAIIVVKQSARAMAVINPGYIQYQNGQYQTQRNEKGF